MRGCNSLLIQLRLLRETLFDHRGWRDFGLTLRWFDISLVGSFDPTSHSVGRSPTKLAVSIFSKGSHHNNDA